MPDGVRLDQLGVRGVRLDQLPQRPAGVRLDQLPRDEGVVRPLVRGYFGTLAAPVKLVREVGRAVKDVPWHLLASPERRAAAATGFLEGAREGARSLTPTGLKEAVQAEVEAYQAVPPAERVGRVLGELTLLALPTKGAKQILGRARGVRGVARAVETRPERLLTAGREAARIERLAAEAARQAEQRGPLLTPTPPDPSFVRSVPAQRGFPTRDPATGKFRRVYTGETGPPITRQARPLQAAEEIAPAAPVVSARPAPRINPRTGLPEAFGPAATAGPATRGAFAREPVEKAYEKVVRQGGRAEGPLADLERRLAQVGQEEVMRMRAEIGAERTARQLGFGGKQGTEAVRRFTGAPEPKKVPPREARRRIERFEQDQEFRRRIEDPKGFVSPRALATIAGAGAGAAAGAALGENLDERIGGALALGLVGAAGARRLTQWAQTNPRLVDQLLAARVEAYLSGTALPKNIATALGAPALTAIEAGSLAPLRQYPSLVRNVGKAIVRPRAVVDIDVTAAGRRPRGPFSRRIAAVDEAAIRALRRAGLTEAQINRALVRTPLAETIGRGNVMADLLESRFGQFIQPFQRTPFDVGIGGLTEVRELLGGPAVKGAVGTAGRRRALTATLMAAGAGAGELTSGDELAPLKVAMLASALGRRAVPFSMGAAVTGGSRMLIGASPLPEFGLDPGQWVPTTPEDIALVRLVRRLQGR